MKLHPPPMAQKNPAEKLPESPVALRQPQVTTVHGRQLHDDYGWLRQRQEQEVIDYLEAENRYTAEVMQGTAELQEVLYQEMVGRIRETDQTVPVPIDDYEYYSRTVEGLQYPIFCRRRRQEGAPEEILLDVNALAAGEKYLRLGVHSVSPDHRLLAYSTDADGSESYRLRILDLASRQHLPDSIEASGRAFVWANDSKSFYYTTLDATHRPFRLHHHLLGTQPADDPVVFEEADERFFLTVYKTLSRRFLCIILGSHTTSEVHYLDFESEQPVFCCLAPRQQGVEMILDHRGDDLFILSNEEAPNFCLLRAPVDDPRPEKWQQMIDHREDVKLEGVDLFRQHLVVYLRRQGLRNIRIFDFAQETWHDIELDEPVYAAWGQDNWQFDSSMLRFVYTSLVTPATTYEYDMNTRQRRLLKQVEVCGGYDPQRFECKRLWVSSADGVDIPVSLVQRRGLDRQDRRPLLLYGYGSYGNSIDPHFASTRLGLLERGFAFAIAHVRGGGELGRRWYDDGKLFAKRHTFEDFIAVAETLISEGYTRPEELVIRGGSAGGLLIGAVINQRPELAAAAIAEVPFVDVINTMLDPSLPLTVIEYEEWGNPQHEDAFEYIRSYSPYDNVQSLEYPHLLVTAGLNDPRVQYWEPAKWVAKLRATKKGDRWLLLRTNMDSGHGGASGRYDVLREEAFKQAFVLKVVGDGADLNVLPEPCESFSP